MSLQWAGKNGSGWWERPPAAICRRIAKEADVFDHLQVRCRRPTQTHGAEVSRRQSVITARGRQFQLTAHEASDLALTLRTGSTLATFDTQLTSAMRPVGGRAHASPDCQPASAHSQTARIATCCGAPGSVPVIVAEGGHGAFAGRFWGQKRAYKAKKRPLFGSVFCCFNGLAWSDPCGTLGLVRPVWAVGAPTFTATAR